MKTFSKIIIFLLVMHALHCLSEKSYAADYKPIQERETLIDTGVIDNGSYMINAGRMLKITYNFLNDNLDYMLTTKGVKKTTVILTPFIIVYGYYFGLQASLLDPLKDVGRDLLCKVGRIKAYYELQSIIGANQQLIEEIKVQPWNMFCVATVELMKSMWFKLKIPFIM